MGCLTEKKGFGYSHMTMFGTCFEFKRYFSTSTHWKLAQSFSFVERQGESLKLIMIIN